MIKHIVMWKLKDEAGGKTKSENAASIKEKLEALVGQIDEIKHLEVGININTSDAAYDAVLVSDFESMEALCAYQVNPKHKAVSEFVGTVSTSRVVADYQY